MFKKFLIAILAIPVFYGLMFVSTMGSKAAPSEVVYDALPSVSPVTNYPSLGYQATRTVEFGDYVHLEGTNRVLDKVTVTMSNWALYETYSSDSRYMNDSDNWTHPITLNIYSNNLDGDGVPDELLATVTQEVVIPWRPVQDDSCDLYGGYRGWADSNDNCFNGLAFNAVFDMSSLNVTLPDDVIIGVYYNTQSYGDNPLGVNGPYNSLNVAVPNGQNVSAGTDDNTDNVYWDTTYPSYTAGFREDEGWTPNGTVAFKVEAKEHTNLYGVGKLNGGSGNVVAGGINFSLTANALTSGKGEVKGNLQYSRENQSVADLSVHAKVECYGVLSDGTVATAAGPADVQNDPSNAVPSDYWMYVAVKEGGTGSGDTVRVRFLSETDAKAMCENPNLETTFPGLVEEGDFTIKP